MRLRDHLAGQALAGLLANPSITNANTIGDAQWARTIGKLAYAVAGRMIENRGVKVDPDPKG